jgi:hypothetical protein
MEKSLSTTPLLGEAEYTQLAKSLQSRIGRNHSHVEIELAPRIAVSD